MMSMQEGHRAQLFLMFINDIPDDFLSRVGILYASDFEWVEPAVDFGNGVVCRLDQIFRE